MPKSKLLSSDKIIKTLKKKGFVFISQKGSHAKFQKQSSKSTLTVIIPTGRKEIPHGTLRSILRQSGLIRSDFE